MFNVYRAAFVRRLNALAMYGLPRGATQYQLVINDESSTRIAQRYP